MSLGGHLGRALDSVQFSLRNDNAIDLCAFHGLLSDFSYIGQWDSVGGLLAAILPLAP